MVEIVFKVKYRVYGEFRLLHCKMNQGLELFLRLNLRNFICSMLYDLKV